MVAAYSCFGHTFSGIVWHMLQEWNQFNRKTLSWWPRNEMISVALHLLLVIWKEQREVGRGQDSEACPCILWIKKLPIVAVKFHFYSLHSLPAISRTLQWPQTHKLHNKIICNYHANKLVLNWGQNDPLVLSAILRHWRHLVNISKYILCSWVP